MLSAAMLRFRLRTIERLDGRLCPSLTLVLVDPKQDSRRAVRALANSNLHETTLVSSAAEPVVLLGDSGTVKPHLLIGLGLAACRRGLRVRYTAADERQLPRLVARSGRLDLLCLDELNYVHLDPRGAVLLFQTLTERAGRASIALASCASFSVWGETLDHPWPAAADRFTFRAHIFKTGSESHCARPEVNRRPDSDRKVWPATMIKPRRNHIIVLTRALRARPLRPHALRRADRSRLRLFAVCGATESEAMVPTATPNWPIGLAQMVEGSGSSA